MSNDRIRIESDGTGPGTHLFIGNTTAEVKNVREATVRISATEIATVDLTVMVPVTEVQTANVDEVTLMCPICAHEETHTCKPDEQRVMGGK